MRLVLASLFLVACGSTQVVSAPVGPACPAQETAPPALPPEAMIATACTIGHYEQVPPEDNPHAIPLAEDAALAQNGPANGKVADQAALVSAAIAAEQLGNYPACVDDEKKALAISDNGRVRLHLSSCERRANKMVNALFDAQRALEIGVASRDTALMKLARVRVKELLALVPHVRFVEPPGTEIHRFTVDERDVPHDALAQRFSLDPGHHVLVLEGTESGRLFQRTCTIELPESTLLPVMLTSR